MIFSVTGDETGALFTGVLGRLVAHANVALAAAWLLALAPVAAGGGSALARRVGVDERRLQAIASSCRSGDAA